MNLHVVIPRRAFAGMPARAPRAPSTPTDGARRALTLVRRGRAVILRVCAAMGYAGWLWSSPALAGLAAVIACEEALECSVVIAILRVETRT